MRNATKREREIERDRQKEIYKQKKRYTTWLFDFGCVGFFEADLGTETLML